MDIIIIHKLCSCFNSRGVFQTLVEKHFPAPDRERINRLLGLEKNKTIAPPPPTVNGKNGLGDSNSKRKCKGAFYKILAISV